MLANNSFGHASNDSVILGIQVCILQTAHSGANAGVVYFRGVESTTGYTFTHCVGYFTSPGIDTR